MSKLLYILILLIKTILSFNIDTDFPIIYADPLFNVNRGNYFGYSLLLYAGDNYTRPWIQIGAPRSNHTFYNDYSEPGIVYRCTIYQKCNLFPVDPLGVKNSRGNTRFGTYRNKKDGAWIGGSMDIHSEFHRVVVCGHRWVNLRGRDLYIQGACYWSEIRSNETEALLPLVNKDNYIHQKSFYNFAMGQAGTSVHFPLKPSKPELLMGAPGVFNWKGSAVKYRDGTELPNMANRRSARLTAESFSDFIIPNMAISNNEIADFGYFGYSTSSGYFFSDQKLLYVAGAPRASTNKGQIKIFDFPLFNKDGLRVKITRQGEQTGEYFGATIAVADVNNDGLDDIIVGAPHYSRKMDEGRVYVFLGNRRGNVLIPDQSAKIEGRAMRGQFGLAIQSLGDLDTDNYADIAISAPYEDDYHGVIYIYNGGPKGLSLKPSQIITGRQISPILRGFGISFSKAVDIDKNLFNDFAVGSYLSGHAVILRTKPVVNLNLTLNSKNARLDHKANNFSIEICVSFPITSSITTLRVNQTIIVDTEFKRAFLNQKPNINQISTEITVNKHQRNCRIIQIGVKEKIRNFLNPIEIYVTQSLVEKRQKRNVLFINKQNSLPEEEAKFCKYCPVIHETMSVKDAKIEVPFALNCGSDNICTADLKLNCSFVGLGFKNNFIIGSKNSLKLLITVSNTGESAYLSQIEILLPENVHLLEIPAFCSEEYDNNIPVIVCDIENPLRYLESKTVILNLDMTEIKNNKLNDYLIFTINAKSKSDDLNIKDNSVNLKLYLLIVADITIKGNSIKDSYYFGNHSLSNASHIYEVQKSGASPINEVILNISIPVSMKTQDGNMNFLKIYEPSGSQDGQPFICQWQDSYYHDIIINNDLIDQDIESNRTKRQIIIPKQKTTADSLPTNRTLFLNCTSEDVMCKTLTCIIGPFRKSLNVARLLVKMVLNITVLEKYALGKKDIIYLTTDSYVKEIEGKRNDRLAVSSVFIIEPPEQIIDTWIIIVSFIAGILILLLIIMGLIKAGFFERKQKNQLELLKQAEVEQEFETATQLSVECNSENETE